MNDLAAESEIWRVIKPLLITMAIGTLTEVDALRLILLFDNVEDMERKASQLPWKVRRARIGKRLVKSEDSLTLLALALHKDPQTIRRWCKQGLIPGAYRTSGGHWRLKYSSAKVEEVVESLAGRIRQPKNILRSQRWKSLKKRLHPLITKHLGTLFKMDAELRHANPSQLHTKNSPKLSERTLNQFLLLHNKGGDTATDYLKLRLAARSLKLQDAKVTASAVAQKLGLSRRTLFRRFPNGLVLQAIDCADKPISRDDQERHHIEAELDHQFIEVITKYPEIPAQPTPRRGNDTNPVARHYG